MRKGLKRCSLGCTIFLVLATFTSCGSLMDKKEDAPKLLTQRKVEFMTREVIKKDIQEKFEADGRVYSSKMQKLAFQKTGKLSFYDVFVGKKVKKGQMLAAIDISEIEHKIKITELKLEQCELRLVLAEKTGDEYKIKEAEIALKIEKMELEKLNEFKDNSTLVSELDGIVASFSSKDIGSMVNPNISIITIMDSGNLGIKFNLKKSNLDKINVGDTIEVAIENEYVETEVVEIEKNQVIAKIPEEFGDVTITSKIKVKKVLDNIKDALIVPKVGIYTDANGNSKVQVLDDGKIVVKKVVLGTELDEDFQVLEGVKEGDQIIVK